jgi:plastocyanin
MRTLLTSLAVASVALGLSACGSSSDKGTSSTTTTFKTGQPVHITASEYKFKPASIVVQGGGATKFELENKGALAHNLRIMENGADVGGTPTFQGGETKSANVSLRNGEYELVCTVGDHANLGMTAQLIVK